MPQPIQTLRTSPEELLRTYFRDLKGVGPLDSASERELARRAQAGDPASAEKLVLATLEQAALFCRRYAGRGVPMADLISAANMALLKAATRFDPARHGRFFRFSQWWIKQELLLEFSRVQRSVRIPHDLLEQGRSMLHSLALLEQRKKGPISLEEAAEHLKITPQNAEQLYTIMQPDISLDTPLEGELGEPSMTMLDTLVDEDQVGQLDETVSQGIANQVLKALDQLNPRERSVLCLLFGIGDRVHSAAEAGQKLELTGEKVKKIRKGALLKLKRIASLERAAA